MDKRAALCYNGEKNWMGESTMPEEEKKIVAQTIILLLTFLEETKKDYLKEEAMRLIAKLEKRLN